MLLLSQYDLLMIPYQLYYFPRFLLFMSKHFFEQQKNSALTLIIEVFYLFVVLGNILYENEARSGESQNTADGHNNASL